MADLDVQVKRKSRFWLYVLLIVVLGGIIYFLLNKNNTFTSDKAPTDSVEAAP
ncbi:MAG: hypothetical protein WKF66_14125 [Pedobacter sp.]